ncbi:MAG TPA: PRC-barrel domain-containing protein [Stellaceae bacterium]|jgi:hypothetical protein
MRRARPAASIVLACWAATASAQNASTPEAPPTTAPDTLAPSPRPEPGAPPSTSAPEANLETLAAGDARAILGKAVSGTAGEDMGLVVDVLFDANKQPRAVVIDFGGFLGVGTRKIAVDWRLLQFYAPDSKTPLKLDLSRADVQSAPEYKPGDKTIGVIAGPSRVAPAPSPVAPPATTPPAATPPEATTPAPASAAH